ncbi:MAG: DEAD/DEAH box helicase, partial [Acidobacteria bacterium]|nr:DEAD/DEAH box helicase [Acidobacteriota bacterium]
MNEVLAYLNASLTGLKIARLGPKSVEKLNRAGIHSLWDLVCFLPRDYLDFSQKYTIPQTPLEVPVQVSGRILSGQAHATQQKKIPLYEMLIDDGFGTLRVLFFNQPYLAKTLKKDSTVSVQGKITFDRLGRVMINPKWRFANPETDVAPGILPIYREIGGLRSEQIADWIQQAIRRIPDGSPRWFEGDLDMRLSLERLHFPRSPEDLEWIRKGEDPGQIHLIIEEFLCFSRSLKRLAQVGNLHKPDLEWANSWRTAFQKALPFELTQDQLSTVQGLEQRLLAKQRLFALIQGDVGSGKTAMALYLAFGFAQAGKQSTLMCPTTILANQHYETAHILLAPLGVRVGLLTSKMEDRQIKATLLATEK